MFLRSGLNTYTGWNSKDQSKTPTCSLVSRTKGKARRNKRCSIPFEVQFIIVKEMICLSDTRPSGIRSHSSVSKLWNKYISSVMTQAKLLHAAVKNDDIETVRGLVNKHGTDILNISDEAGWPRARSNNTEVVQQYCNETRWTVFHTVCFLGHENMFRFLLNEYSALDVKDHDYILLLSHLAIYNGQMHIWVMIAAW